MRGLRRKTKSPAGVRAARETPLRTVLLWVSHLGWVRHPKLLGGRSYGEPRAPSGSPTGREGGRKSMGERAAQAQGAEGGGQGTEPRPQADPKENTSQRSNRNCSDPPATLSRNTRSWKHRQPPAGSRQGRAPTTQARGPPPPARGPPSHGRAGSPSSFQHPLGCNKAPGRPQSPQPPASCRVPAENPWCRAESRRPPSRGLSHLIPEGESAGAAPGSPGPGPEP